MIEFTIYNADALQQLQLLPDCSVDSLVSDPPAAISFMGKAWDNDKGGRDNWIAWLTSIMAEAFRILKPGGHGFIWALPRRSHWTAFALENAGFEIRDISHHLFSTGFPKNLDIGKAIDREAGAKRNVIRVSANGTGAQPNKLSNHGKGDTGIGYADGAGKTFAITSPATSAAHKWDGFGTALKPAVEHWILIRKPISEKTIAKNILKWGTGGLNIGGCRIETDFTSDDMLRPVNRKGRISETWKNGSGFKNENNQTTGVHPAGRWPAHLTHDGSELIVSEFPREAGASSKIKKPYSGKNNGIYGDYREYGEKPFYDDSGSAARFFYCAKASQRDREEGINHDMRLRCNNHPTVKNTNLMRWLIRLITPPSGVVLDCFMGSGSTGKASVIEGMSFIGIEQLAEYCEIAEARIGFALRHRRRFLRNTVAQKPKPPEMSDDTLELFG